MDHSIPKVEAVGAKRMSMARTQTLQVLLIQRQTAEYENKVIWA